MSSFTQMSGIRQAAMKVSWAHEHLDLFDKKITGWLDSKPARITSQEDAQRGEYVIRLTIDPIPAEVVLILGDFVSCLRASLDHLAGMLTRIPKGTPSDSATFPILKANNSVSRKTFTDATQGIPTNAVKVIESFQPYHAGQAAKTTHLWRLHRLWNIDKHRRIPHRATRAKALINFPITSPPVSNEWNNENGEVRFKLSDRAHVTFEPTVDVSIEFGDESEGILVNAFELLDIYEFVAKEVFPAFKSFF